MTSDRLSPTMDDSSADALMAELVAGSLGVVEALDEAEADASSECPS